MTYPVVDFEILNDRMKASGLDIRNVFNSDVHGHHEAWRVAKGLPTPKTVAETQLQYAEYRDAPDGGATLPVYIDFWHFLLDLSKKRKSRLIRVIDQIIPEKKMFSDAERQNAYAHLAHDSGIRLEEATAGFKSAIDEMVKQMELRHDGIKIVVDAIHKEYGGPIIVRIPSSRD